MPGSPRFPGRAAASTRASPRRAIRGDDDPGRLARHQPGSAISQWFARRVGTARGRVRRIAIVARKLLVALWRYVGVIPEGAVLKA